MMTKFSDSFYIQPTQVKLRSAALPGVLGNPMDPRPWLVMEQRSIYADNPENDKPLAHPVLFIATQNPPSYAGRVEEDPALRHRLMKFSLNWPPYGQQEKPKNKTKYSNALQELFPRGDKGFFQRVKEPPQASIDHVKEIMKDLSQQTTGVVM